MKQMPKSPTTVVAAQENVLWLQVQMVNRGIIPVSVLCRADDLLKELQALAGFLKEVVGR
jgi:hypothetical protein